MIERSALLACAPERAFRLFTERASDWWPETLRHTGDPASTISIQADGPFRELARDGEGVELGRVVVWEPAQRLVLDFYPGTDAEHPTAVEVRFTAVEGGTRVDIRHGPKPESAATWADGAPRYARSWDLVTAALEKADADPDW